MKAIGFALIPLAILLAIGAYFLFRPASEFDKATAHYAFLKKNGADQAQLCDAATAVRDAAAAEQNQKEYPLADIEARLECNQLALDRL